MQYTVTESTAGYSARHQAHSVVHIVLKLDQPQYITDELLILHM